MRKIELDGRQMDSRAQAHHYIKKALELPEYYGGNLDALSDCLGEQSGMSIVLIHQSALINALGDYGNRLIRVFEDSARGRKDLRFRALE